MEALAVCPLQMTWKPAGAFHSCPDARRLAKLQSVRAVQGIPSCAANLTTATCNQSFSMRSKGSAAANWRLGIH